MPDQRTAGRCQSYRSPMKPTGTLIATALLLALSGCGGGGDIKAAPAAAAKASASASASASAAAAEEAAEARERAAAKRKARRTAVYRECRTVAGRLDADLTDLNSRLSVGLTFDKYNSAVGDAQVSFDKLVKDAKARGGISHQCVKKVAMPLGLALSAYEDANSTWNACVSDPYCTFDKGSEPVRKVQAKWSKAGRYVERADAALSGLQP